MNFKRLFPIVLSAVLLSNQNAACASNQSPAVETALPGIHFLNSPGNYTLTELENISAPTDLRPFLRRMLVSSPTFRWQCYRILRAPMVRVRIVYVAPMPDDRSRARSIICKYSNGLVQATVELYPPHTHDAELIAHEFEHVLEQLEGWDLKSLAISRNSGVHRVTYDTFETKRAIRAGETIADEVMSYRARK